MFFFRSDDDSQDETFFSAEEGDLNIEDETAQEKKLRLAKIYLEEIQKQEQARKERDEDENENDEDNNFLLATSQRLKEDVLEGEGRLRKEIADQIEPDLDNMCTLSSSKWLKR